MLGKLVKVVVPVAALAGVIGMMVIASRGVSMPVLDTRGVIGDTQRDTLYLAVSIMLIIVVPVFLLLIFIAFRYRDTNPKTTYLPDWGNNNYLEMIWWGVPILIILILSVLTWKTTHSLDPYQPLVSDKKPLHVQVIALQWKWLFLYPEAGIASVGELAMPIDTPVVFTITSDAPMNSFWIPQLGGQIYAMSGMNTQLHLMASQAGSYEGSSANLSGEGFSGMKFIARASDEKEFDAWVASAKSSSSLLGDKEYNDLVKPSKNNPSALYASYQPGLYNTIMMKYTPHGGHTTTNPRGSTLPGHNLVEAN